MRIRPSLLPHESQSSFSDSLAFAGSGTSVAGGFVFGANENPPIYANVSRRHSPKFRDWPPPIESPASAVFAVLLHWVPRLDGRDDVIEQVSFECRERRRVFDDVSDGTVVLLCPAVPHDDAFRNGLSVRDQVVEQH